MTSFNLTAIMYHFVGDPIFPGLKTLPLTDFKRQLSYLQKNYHLIAWPDLKDFILHKRPLPPNACLLTFDDGTKDHFKIVLPELVFKKIPALFFILGRDREDGLAFVHLLQCLVAKLGESETREAFLQELTGDNKDLFFNSEKQCLKDYPESRFDDLKFRTFKRVAGKYMFQEAYPIILKLFERHVGSSQDFAEKIYLRDSDIMEMKARGMHFGGHGVQHRWMTTLHSEEKEEEIQKMADVLQKIEPGPWAFSYPYGDYDRSFSSILKRHGFAAAFTVKELTSHSNEFEIHRLDAHALSP